MSKGNIKEAAVVFSREGMNAFANMFGNSMESAVVNVLSNRMDDIMKNMESKMESIVELKMLEMLEGMTEGMRQFTGGSLVQQESITPELKEELEEAMDNWETSMTIAEPIETPIIDWEATAKKMKEEEKAMEEWAPKMNMPLPIGTDLEALTITGEYIPEPRKVSVNQSDLEYLEPLVVIYLKHHGETRVSVMMKHLEEDHNLDIHPNATMIMSRLIKQNPSIERGGYGVYKYEEKNFKPTV